MILLYSFSKLIPLQEQKSLSSFGKLRTKGFFNKLACRQWVDKGDQIVWTDAVFFCRSLAIFIPEYLPGKASPVVVDCGPCFFFIACKRVLYEPAHWLALVTAFCVFVAACIVKSNSLFTECNSFSLQPLYTCRNNVFKQIVLFQKIMRYRMHSPCLTHKKIQ